MGIEILKRILTVNEALAYTFLLGHAPKKASDVAQALSVARPVAYQTLETLIEKRLVVKHKPPGKAAVFNPQHPIYLQELCEREERRVREHRTLLQTELPDLISKFHLRFGGIPGFRTFVGVRGINELYEDILNEGQNIRLIRSLDDHKHADIKALIRPQMKAQVQIGIRVRSISPYHRYIPKNYAEWYGHFNIDQRMVSPERLRTPAQIIIYANKVALTSFGDMVITTIVEDVYIKETHASIFEYLWETSRAEHEHYLKIVSETHEERSF